MDREKNFSAEIIFPIKCYLPESAGNPPLPGAQQAAAPSRPSEGQGEKTRLESRRDSVESHSGNSTLVVQSVVKRCSSVLDLHPARSANAVMTSTPGADKRAAEEREKIGTRCHVGVHTDHTA
ncbi:hypothetical protein AGIG_G12784 [Arapaima gigas]